jgi:hypothetical protein
VYDGRTLEFRTWNDNSWDNDVDPTLDVERDQ